MLVFLWDTPFFDDAKINKKHKSFLLPLVFLIVIDKKKFFMIIGVSFL
jgi:hypothetical protein